VADIKFAAFWAISGAVVLFVAFAINFWALEGSYPGYRLLAYPGITVAKFFSEEIYFWPKLSIMIAGQYVIYFLIIFVGKKLVRLVGRTSS
jgi:hypothetical protein